MKQFLIGLGLLVSMAVLGFFAYVLVWYVPTALYTEAKCLKNGWKDYRVSIGLQKYCVREENEYEITKPLSEVL